MDVIDETCEKGVVERRFDLVVDGETVPGLWWSPEGASGPRPTVLIGHGGTQHKAVPNVLSLARRLVRHLGYGAVAIDAPDHGDRVADPEAAEKARRRLQRQIAGGRRPGATPQPIANDPKAAEAWVRRTETGVAEWRALVDALEKEDLCGSGPFGYWGVSMGTAIGLPFVAAEPRIRAAVLGLAGLGNRPGGEAFEAAARSLDVPILFVFQNDDELMTRDSGLALWDAIGSSDKTLHLNPGGHVDVPLFERESYEAFYVRHLGPSV